MPNQDRKLATIQTIKDIQPIPDADAIEVAKVYTKMYIYSMTKIELIYYREFLVVDFSMTGCRLKDLYKTGAPVKLNV